MNLKLNCHSVTQTFTLLDQNTAKAKYEVWLEENDKGEEEDNQVKDKTKETKARHKTER